MKERLSFVIQWSFDEILDIWIDFSNILCNLNMLNIIYGFY